VARKRVFGQREVSKYGILSLQSGFSVPQKTAVKRPNAQPQTHSTGVIANRICVNVYCIVVAANFFL